MNARLLLRSQSVPQPWGFDGPVFLEMPMPELVIPPKAAPQAPRSNGQGCRVIGAAKAKNDLFAITVNQGAIGLVPVDLERGLPAAAGHGEGADTLEEHRGR